MANSAQARKRVRQAEKSRQRNTGQRSMMRTLIKNVLNAVDAGDKQKATDAYTTAQPIIDRIAGKGLIHKSKAARHKRQLNTRIRAMQ